MAHSDSQKTSAEFPQKGQAEIDFIKLRKTYELYRRQKEGAKKLQRSTACVNWGGILQEIGTSIGATLK